MTLSLLSYGQYGIVVSGQSIEVSEGKISSSVGQIDYQYSISTSCEVNAGIQQSHNSTLEMIELNSKGISVYPNPTQDMIKIELESCDNDVHIIVYTAQGNIVMSEKHLQWPNITYSFGSFAPGIYLMELIQGKELRSIVKIIKQ